MYVPSFLSERNALDYPVLGAAVCAALLGSLLGNRYLKKVTMRGVQRIVAVMLFSVAIGLISGAL
jgi:hypothetical protein